MCTMFNLLVGMPNSHVVNLIGIYGNARIMTARWSFSAWCRFRTIRAYGNSTIIAVEIIGKTIPFNCLYLDPILTAAAPYPHDYVKLVVTVSPLAFEAGIGKGLITVERCQKGPGVLCFQARCCWKRSPCMLERARRSTDLSRWVWPFQRHNERCQRLVAV